MKELGKSDEALQKYHTSFNNLKTPYVWLNRELKFKEFKKRGTLILPEKILLDERDEFKEINGHQQLIFVPICSEFIPITHVFAGFFEIPGVFDRTSINI